jgi:hypothetical protein
MTLDISIKDAVGIECALRGAATDLRMDADESERLHMHRSAAIKRREADEAARLSGVVKLALDSALAPKETAA